MRALSLNRNPTPLWRMIDRAQRWASAMDWSERGRVVELLEQTNALVPPDETAARNVHLLGPA